jgi:hypothetical protein
LLLLLLLLCLLLLVLDSWRDSWHPCRKHAAPSLACRGRAGRRPLGR